MSCTTHHICDCLQAELASLRTRVLELERERDALRTLADGAGEKVLAAVSALRVQNDLALERLARAEAAEKDRDEALATAERERRRGGRLENELMDGAARQLSIERQRDALREALGGLGDMDSEHPGEMCWCWRHREDGDSPPEWPKEHDSYCAAARALLAPKGETP